MYEIKHKKSLEMAQGGEISLSFFHLDGDWNSLIELLHNTPSIDREQVNELELDFKKSPKRQKIPDSNL